EAQTARIDLSDDDLGALERTLTYLYTEDYNEIDLDTIEESAPEPDSTPINFTELLADATQDVNASMVDETTHTLSKNTRIACLNNTRVYALAEKYDIQGLKALAVSKFRLHSTAIWTVEDTVSLLEEVYNSTPETDRGLRDIMVIVCSAELMPDLIADAGFCDIMQKDGSMALELLTGLQRQYAEVCQRHALNILDFEEGRALKAEEHALHIRELEADFARKAEEHALNIQDLEAGLARKAEELQLKNTEIEEAKRQREKLRTIMLKNFTCRQCTKPLNLIEMFSFPDDVTWKCRHCGNQYGTDV
ncbi:MAG: hypothetical protein Q9224_007195, partial [Gallowayella concinna]